MWQWVITCCGLCDPDSDPENESVLRDSGNSKTTNGLGVAKHALDPRDVEFEIDTMKRKSRAVGALTSEQAAKRSKAFLGNSFGVLEREFRDRGYDEAAILSMKSVFSWICDSASEVSLQPSIYPESDDKISNIEDDPEYQAWVVRLADFSETTLTFDDGDDNIDYSPELQSQDADPVQASEQKKDKYLSAVDAIELERPETPRREEKIASDLSTRAHDQQLAETREQEKQVAIAERIINQKEERDLSHSATETSPEGNLLVVLRQEHDSEIRSTPYSPSSVDTL